MQPEFYSREKLLYYLLCIESVSLALEFSTCFHVLLFVSSCKERVNSVIAFTTDCYIIF